jgi:serine/threonine protein kinase/tetratricopeptide (TPR) repeat protein
MTEESLFYQALAQPPAERAAFLDAACAGQPELRGAVEALLAAHEASGHPLDRPALSPPPAPVVPTTGAEPERGPTVSYLQPPTIPVGTVIAGKFKVLECLGEGGMGTVYVAEQTQPVRRKVALKLVKPGMDSTRVLARFEAERQALALMDHPHIAKVLDAGLTEQGRPFFVMEYIKGVPLTDYCDAAHLAVPERLALFIAVCQAVQHAHQKGIIHRDLKPSNILVALYDGKPVPKVIDFGLAKALHQPLTERTLYTAHEIVLGTPLYMSPEQAELNNLDIDTRSDIYALGVILYELLTGATPLDRQRFKEAAWNEMLRMIKEEEPPKPSTRLSGSASLPAVAAQRQLAPVKLARLLRGELDWIVMKALEKDRNRRYETANGLALDIERYLAEEPVLAGPPSVTYRLRKFLRRNKGQVLAACLVLLALVGGIVGTTLGLIAARRQRDAAEAAAAAEKQAKEIAMMREAETQAAAVAEKQAKEIALAREAETRAVLDFVENQIFAAAQPEGQDGGRGRDVMLRRALEEALPFVETSFTDQPLLEARLRLTLGQSFWRLGESKIAAEQCERARTLYAKHLGPDHPDTLASLVAVANNYSALGRHDDALKLRQEIVTLYTKQLGPDHPHTLWSTLNLAVSYAAVGRDADALKLNAETLARMKARLGPDDPVTLMAMDNLATYYTAVGRPAEALKLHEEALALLKIRRGPDHPETLLSMNNLCGCYAALGRHADAVQLGEKAVAQLKDKLGPGHRHTLASMEALANNYAALGRHADALKLREEMLALQKAKLGPDHPDTLANMMNVAVIYDTLERYDDAVKLHEETLALKRVRLGREHADTVESMLGLAYSYAALGRHADSLRLYEEALAIRKAKLGPGHRDTLVCMNNIAGCYRSLGRIDDAIKLQEETLKLRKAKLGADDPDTLFSMNQLVKWYAGLGRYADAAKLLEEFFPIQKAKFGADHANTLKNMHDLAYCYGVLGRHADSLKLIEARLALMKAKLGLHHRDTLLAMNDRANQYANFGRQQEAIKLREELLPLMQAHLGRDDPDTLGSMTNLALSYAAFGRHADAARLNEETLALTKAKLGPDHLVTLLSRDNLAVNYAALGRHADALKLRQETLALRKAKLGEDHPDTLWSTWPVAESLVALDRGAEAVVRIDECMKRTAGKEVDPGLVPGLMDVRLRRFEKAKDAAGCRATAEMWEKLNRTDAASLYRAAWMRAGTATVLRAGAMSEAAQKEAAAEADRAMAWLQQAVAAGYRNVAHMKRDKALDVLRDRADFKKLLAGLEAGEEKDKK